MDKRPNQHLNHEPGLKKLKTRRTTYFFQPQNTLSFNSKKQEDEKENSPQNSTKTPEHAAFHNIKALPEQSSDDSFEGVRWRGGASPKRQVDTRCILSSPLKNSDKLNTRSGASESVTATVNNEVTDSILSKYGLGLEGVLSQTPHKPKLSISPVLARSKLFDPKCINKLTPSSDQFSTPSLSRLNTWIDRFATNLPQTTPETTFKKPLPASKDDADESEDDLFSDDDSVLATLNVQQFSTLVGTQKQNEQNMEGSAETRSGGDADASFAESDPFMDDIDIEDLEKKVSSQHQTKHIPKHQLREEELLNKLLASISTEQTEDLGAKISYSRSDFVRYQVTAVMKGTFSYQNHTRKQLILSVKDREGCQSKLIVRGDSSELSIQAKDIIHVILTSPEAPKLVDNSHNLLIWNPDVLVTSTVVADQLFCPRKTVIMKRFKFPGYSSLPLLIGTIVHEIFQSCFITERYDNNYLEEIMNNEIRENLVQIYSLGDVVSELKEQIRQRLPFITLWFETFYKKAPVDIPTNQRNQKIKFSVADGLDLEESVWSPMFGLKGMVDVTLKANFKGEYATSQALLPMEIKTSKPYLSHQAQAALYSLLFKDRYNFDISSFLLVYALEEGLTTKHDISVPDLKSLVHLRNQISHFLKSGQNELPDLMRQQKCDKCMIQEACMTINYLTEDGTAEDSGILPEVYEDLTAHLKGKPSHAAFFNYWNELLTQEEHFLEKFNRDLWVFTAQEREMERGKAISDLVISTHKQTGDGGLFFYTFVRKPGTMLKSMQNTQITKHDKVVISDDQGRFALSQGYVQEVWPDSITISTRRRIIPTSLKTDKFHRASVLKLSQQPSQNFNSAVIFRIDKDEMFYGMGVARFNLLNLFLKSGDKRRRDLIVDSKAPRFEETHNFVDETHFNEDQVRAMRRVLASQDYSLILGMPGTGKTTLIAHLIKRLSMEGKSVLLCSYTNSAVDNILLKLKDLGVDFLRIGNASRIHQDIKQYVPGSEECPVDSFDDFELVYRGPSVVGATCLAIGDLAFSVRDHFDYCIIDESSQVSLPLSLGPLSLCDKFVLVGDHHQLPPLVINPNAEVRSGLSTSLFQKLANEHPESVCELTYQYRMCEEVMSLSNSFIYDGRLKCGSPEIAKQYLDIPNIGGILSGLKKDVPLTDRWLDEAFRAENKCLFLNHDTLEGFETVTGDNVTNLTEVGLIRETIEGLCACGVKESSIGVMTLYRSQLRVLTQALRHRPALEILTADRFQGRDKDCIIISLVRSNKERKAGDLVKDWRRMNVALTRARSKLLIFGSLSTLQNTATISDFIKLFKEKNWIYHLPSNAESVYEFDAASKPSKKTDNTSSVKKIGEKTLDKHPVARDIFKEMDINLCRS